MDLKNKFITWYFNEFHATSLFQRMLETTEGSSYHREVNVGVHTDMVVAQYLTQHTTNGLGGWTVEDLCGAYACAFHDVGKPAACEMNGIKFKPDRGNYLSFGGHEQISARLWEDYAMTNWEIFSNMGLEHFKSHVFVVGWMIEHHLPWGVKDPKKRRMLVQTLKDYNILFPFANMLVSDTFGRISDDAEAKREKVSVWLKDLITEECKYDWTSPNTTVDGTFRPVLYLPIGSSGCGKSTYRAALATNDPQYRVRMFSWDDLRQEFYGDDYAEAYRCSIEDDQFMSKANARFIDLVKQGKPIYVDNTNLTRKRRNFYITEARRRGYFVVAVIFPIALQTVLDRQFTRPDKNVPASAVRQHYMNIQLPSMSEVDNIITIA